MKKRIYLILLSVTVIFFSCRDDSGKFEEQLFTHAQLNNAIVQCIELASDSALNVLCVVDTVNQVYGYSYYFEPKDNLPYRIELPASAKNVLDTLKAYSSDDSEETNYIRAIEKLILDMNRAAEQCGNLIKSDFLTPLIKNTTFPNPYSLIHNESNYAITNYVKEIKQTELLSLLINSILYKQFQDIDVIAQWNALQQEYIKITGDFVSIEILPSSAQQMIDGFFKKISLVEEAIRENPKLRESETGILYLVFATLD